MPRDVLILGFACHMGNTGRVLFFPRYYAICCSLRKFFFRQPGIGD